MNETSAYPAEFVLAILYGGLIWAVLNMRHIERRQISVSSLLSLMLITAACLGCLRIVR